MAAHANNFGHTSEFMGGVDPGKANPGDLMIQQHNNFMMNGNVGGGSSFMNVNTAHQSGISNESGQRNFTFVRDTPNDLFNMSGVQNLSNSGAEQEQFTFQNSNAQSYGADGLVQNPMNGP